MTDLSPNARAFLQSARRTHAPSAADRARVRAALNARMAAPVALSSRAALAGPKALAAKSIVAKLLAGVMFVGALGGAAVWHSTRSTRHAEQSHVSISGASTPSAYARTAPSFISSTVVDDLPRIAPSAAPEIQPVIPSRPHLPTRSRSSAGITTAIEPIVVSGALAAPTPVPGFARTLADELQLVRAAQEALRNHEPARALTLLDEHAARFPLGLLREERSAARVFALCALDRRDDARTEAARLLREAPNSPHANRVRSSCVAADESSAAP